MSEPASFPPGHSPQFPTATEEQRRRTRRTIGQYVSLAIAVLFGAETIFLFSRALHEAGKDQNEAIRFLVLTIGVFVTFAAALFAFARRIRLAGLFVLGLLLIQPAVSSISRLLASDPHGDLPFTMFAAVVGALVIAVVIQKNAKLPSDSG